MGKQADSFRKKKRNLQCLEVCTKTIPYAKHFATKYAFFLYLMQTSPFVYSGAYNSDLKYILLNDFTRNHPWESLLKLLWRNRLILLERKKINLQCAEVCTKTILFAKHFAY